MEELNGTENLAREILEDARRKAARHLAEAEHEIQRLRDDFAAQTEAEKQELTQVHQARMQRLQDDARAALPLEFRRQDLVHESVRLSSALCDWLGHLGEQELVQLFLIRLDKILEFFRYHPEADVCFKSLGPQARIPIQNLLSQYGIKGPEPWMGNAATPLDRGLLIATHDGKFRFRLTCVELLEELLEEHGAELRDALMGRGDSP